jgi:hypothetical protein
MIQRVRNIDYMDRITQAAGLRTRYKWYGGGVVFLSEGPVGSYGKLKRFLRLVESMNLNTGNGTI